jgi:hypothetical protein
MSNAFTRYVDVVITKETALLSAAGFGVPILLTDNVATIDTTTRVKTYLSLAAVEEDFADTTDEYKAAKAYFNQQPENKRQPEKLLIGCWDRVGGEDIKDALEAIRNVNDDWYVMGITASLRTYESDLETLATEIEAMRKVLILGSNNADMLTLSDTTNLLYKLRNKDTSGYKRTMIVYHDDATLYPDWSIMGEFLPIEPGKSQMAYHILAGTSAGADFIGASNITEVQKDNLFANNGNTTVGVAGQVFFYPGIMVGGKNIDREGEWFDIVRSIDFLQARTEEGLLSLLLEKSEEGSKVPFTDAGIAMVKNRLSNLLAVYGVQQGILVDGSVNITVPKRADTTTEDRDDRILRDVDFTAELAGAIGKVIVRGKVRV